jgi:hypothetical protein
VFAVYDKRVKRYQPNSFSNWDGDLMNIDIEGTSSIPRARSALR